MAAGTVSANESALDLHLRSGPQMLLYRSLARDLADRRPGRILDWGCGFGQVSALLRAEGLDAVPYDFDPDLDEPATIALERYPDMEARFSPDPVCLPFPDDGFDTVLSCGVLEHVQGPDASLDEIHRVLRPDGTFFVTNLPNRSPIPSGSLGSSAGTTTASSRTTGSIPSEQR